MSSEINVISRTQHIIVEPSSGSVSVINAGPSGPGGPSGATPATYPSVANAAALPAVASSVGKAYWVVDTATVVVSDGTRWRTMYGDTGYRDILSLTNNTHLNPAEPGAATFIRRKDNTVEMYCDFIAIAGTIPSPIVLLTLPVGFRPPFMVYGLLYWYAGGSPVANIYLANGAINLYSLIALNPCRIYGTWGTTDAWPTTLPGNAHGTIP